MTEEKAKKIVVASTVGAVLLVVILVAVMVYQLIAIGVENKRKNEYENAIAEYNRLIEEGEDLLVLRSKKAWIVRRARELGYISEDQKVLD
ncbi:MAG: hypothetical protein II988_03355 [Clostridia bacterium]|nr:hypothetical protein [Clostridia bacterium]